MATEALMLDWLAERHDLAACGDAARALEQAIETGCQTGAVRPIEQGGAQGTIEGACAVIDQL